MSNLPEGYKLDKAFFRSGEDGCQAQPYAEWVATAWSPRHTCLMGFGTTEDQANESVIAKCIEDCKLYSYPAENRIKTYINRAKAERTGLYEYEVLEILDYLVNRDSC